MNLSLALAGIEDFYRRIYWQAPTATTYDERDYVLTYSGVNWLHSINQLWLRKPHALDDHILLAAAQFFNSYQAEYSIVIADSHPASIQRWLHARQYVERTSDPVYGLCGLPRPRNTHREAIIVQVCAEQQRDLLKVLYGAFFMGPEIGRCAVRTEHFSDPAIRHYLAYVDGEAAACATIILGDGIAGVWNVGTLRPFRRQGLASAILMRALADAAADGYPESILVASQMGRPLYEEMGYKLLGNTFFYGPGD